MSETQAEIKPEALQCACSACKTCGEQSRDTAQRGQKGLAHAPSQALCHTPPHSGSAVCFPLGDTPGSLCSSPAAFACSNSHPFQLLNLPQKQTRGLSSCEQRGGTDKRPLPRSGQLLCSSSITH